MSGDWGRVLAVLDLLAPSYSVLFIFFLLFSVYALTNVFIAVFLEASVQVAQSDSELAVLDEMEQKSVLTHVLQQVFEELDGNDNGSLTLREFEKHVDDERIAACLRHLGLDLSHARTLFRLLDTDSSGEVDLDEFVSGCLRLK